jgi:hypothetical protein
MIRRNHTKRESSQKITNANNTVDDNDASQEISFEFCDSNTNVKLVHIKRKNVDAVSLDRHLSDLNYSGNYLIAFEN